MRPFLLPLVTVSFLLLTSPSATSGAQEKFWEVTTDVNAFTVEDTFDSNDDQVCAINCIKRENDLVGSCSGYQYDLAGAGQCKLLSYNAALDGTVVLPTGTDKIMHRMTYSDTGCLMRPHLATSGHDGAKAFCESLGMRLVEPSTADIQADMMTVINPDDPTPHIGLVNDRSGAAYVWRWENSFQDSTMDLGDNVATDCGVFDDSVALDKAAMVSCTDLHETVCQLC